MEEAGDLFGFSDFFEHLRASAQRLGGGERGAEEKER